MRSEEVTGYLEAAYPQTEFRSLEGREGLQVRWEEGPSVEAASSVVAAVCPGLEQSGGSEALLLDLAALATGEETVLLLRTRSARTIAGSLAAAARSGRALEHVEAYHRGEPGAVLSLSEELRRHVEGARSSADEVAAGLVLDNAAEADPERVGDPTAELARVLSGVGEGELERILDASHLLAGHLTTVRGA